jgi:hypothetical protein
VSQADHGDDSAMRRAWPDEASKSTCRTPV